MFSHWMNTKITRLHSSRMRTARTLTVSHSMLCAREGGVLSPGGVYLVTGEGGVLSPRGVYLVPGGVLSHGGRGCT